MVEEKNKKSAPKVVILTPELKDKVDKKIAEMMTDEEDLFDEAEVDLEKAVQAAKAELFWNAEQRAEVHDLCDFLKALYDESEHVGVRTKLQNWRRSLVADCRRCEEE